MSNSYFLINEISKKHDLFLSDAEIRISSFRLNKFINQNQKGGSMIKCLSVVELLNLGNVDIIKHIFTRLLNNNLEGINHLCHKFNK